MPIYFLSHIVSLLSPHRRSPYKSTTTLVTIYTPNMSGDTSTPLRAELVMVPSCSTPQSPPKVEYAPAGGGDPLPSRACSLQLQLLVANALFSVSRMLHSDGSAIPPPASGHGHRVGEGVVPAHGCQLPRSEVEIPKFAGSLLDVVRVNKPSIALEGFTCE